MTMLEYKRYKKKSLKGNKRDIFFGRRKTNKARTKKKKGVMKYILGGLSLILVLLVCAKFTHSFITTSPLFRINDVEVVRDKGLKDFDFEKAAKVDEKESLFTLDLQEVVKTFKENPWVEQVAVRKVFPGKLVVVLTKRKPAAMINLKGLYFVDGGGKIIKKVSRYDTKIYPVITGFDRKMMQKKKGKDNLLRVLSLRKVLKGSVVDGNVSEINYNYKEGIAIVLQDSGLRVKLGTTELVSAFRRLEKYYDKIKNHRRDAGYIDLQYPGKIIVGQKKSK